jgi:hypothetical protein
MEDRHGEMVRQPEPKLRRPHRRMEHVRRRVPQTIRGLTKRNNGQRRTPETGNDLATRRQIRLKLRETGTTSWVQSHQPRNNALLHGRTTKIGAHRRPTHPNPYHLPPAKSKSNRRSTIQSPDRHTGQIKTNGQTTEPKLVPTKEPATTTTKEPTSVQPTTVQLQHSPP